MKRRLLLAFGFTSLLSAAHRSFEQLAAACVPEAAIATLRPLVEVESAFQVNALSVNEPEALARKLGYRTGRIALARQPRTRSEALAWMRRLAAEGITVSVGLTQVNTEEAVRRGIDPGELLDPCTNLRLGWQIFQGDYAQAARRWGAGQTALRAAFSLYNTGQWKRGFTNGYVDSILHAATRH